MNNHVVFVVNHDLVIYNFRKEIVEALLNDGYKVTIISPYGERIPFLKEMGCNYVEISVDRHGINPVPDLKLIWNLKKIIKLIDPKVVLSFTIKPNIYTGIVCSYLNIPYITNITGLGSSLQKDGFVKRIITRLYKISLKKANKVFFQNSHDFNFFIESQITNNRNSEIIPGSGVNIDFFNLQNYEESDIIKFVFISRLMKEKGTDLYLEAAEYIKSKFSNVEFHICGFSEEDYRNVLSKLQDKKVIIYHGMVLDIRSVLKDMHCTVHPTYYPEGISNVLLESAAFGKPLITTDRPGCREVVDDGINGFLVNEKDLLSLINALEKFIRLSFSEKKQMGINGRKKVEKEFDRRIVVKKYIDEIGKISG